MGWEDDEAVRNLGKIIADELPLFEKGENEPVHISIAGNSNHVVLHTPADARFECLMRLFLRLIREDKRQR